jgi:ketosteroid isomerase-like protein
VKNPNKLSWSSPRFLSLGVLLAFTVSCGRPGENPRDVQAATDAIRQQIAKYTAALDAADPTLAAEVWLTSPEVSFISPAGHQHGWEEVKKVYDFFGTTFSERHLAARDISVHVLGDAAWAEFYWHFAAKQRSDGAPVQTDGRETQVYRKMDGTHWRLVHVHYSGPPAAP